MAKTMDPLGGLTLRDLMADDGVTFEFGEEFDDGEDDRFKFNPQVNFTDDELVKFMNLELSDDEDDAEPNEEGRIPLSLGVNFEKIKAKMQNLTGDGKVKKLVRQKGVGELMPDDSQVTVKYSGYFEGQDEPYDSSHMRGVPDRFRLNNGGLIMGLDIAIQSMQKHEVSIFWIHADNAYGELGCPPLVPPNAEVMFIVHLIDFLDNGTADTWENLEVENRRAFKHVAVYAKKLMTTGGDNFKKGQIRRSIRDYKRAIERLEEAQLDNDEEEIEMKQMLSRAYQNLAVSFNRENEPRRACIACNQVPNKTAKTYFNYGRALIKMGEYNQALEELEKGLRLMPNNLAIVKEMQLAEELNAKYLTMEKSLWSKCLGINKSDDNDKNEAYKNLAQEMCKNFLDNENILRQPLPEGLTRTAEQIIRKQALSAGITITTLTKYGKEMKYMEKKDYK